MTHHFSIEEALNFGWEKTKAHSRLVFQLILTLFALQVVTAIVQASIGNTFLGILAQIALTTLGIFIGVGMTRIVLKIARGQHASYGEILPDGELVIRYLLAVLISGLIVVIGLILLIIPGIYLGLRYSMVRFAVIDGAGVRDSLRQSAKMTHGVKWRLLGFFVVIGLLNIAGAICLLVGLLVTIPVTMLAYAHVYQKLHAHVESKA